MKNFINSFLGICLVIIIAASLIIPAISIYWNGLYCEQWGREAERQTRFISNWPWYSDCLVKTNDGWISGKALKVVETPTIK